MRPTFAFFSMPNSVRRDSVNLITSNPLTVDPNLRFRMLRGPYERFDSKLPYGISRLLWSAATYIRDKLTIFSW
jgi:hypothetical protein